MDARIVFPAILVALLAVSASLTYVAHDFYGQHMLPGIFNSAATQMAQDNADSGLPKRLVIPSINVDANIIYVGLTRDGAVDAPKGPSDVAWFKLGAKPGQKGSSIIVGHFGPWKNGVRSVFDKLGDLKVGDTIYVQDDKGVTLSFKVTGSHMYGQNESPPEVFNKDDGMYLNLITCSGTWLAGQQTYSRRLVVFTEKIV